MSKSDSKPSSVDGQQKPQKQRVHRGGMPKGHKTAKVLAKEQERERLRQLLTPQLQGVADALVSRCKGVRYFVTRAKSGKYEIVTNPDAVVAALNKEDDYTGEFYTDKPEISAIKEFFDRTVDKSKEQEQDINLKGSIDLVQRLAAARQRLSKK